ncbi:FimB/Mfa2 family fimbrial subunit [Bacteroides sp. 519]|uniref:FimB/Mfa2 family fimbrial subunit n=1 Tax=Bacteroides sp. 519 TaxID=2302937 RepID=UPI0013D48C38|nr:FimB/Mfa2 family fimbrial subunit [Bacteroides sp. 519]
MLTSCLGEGDLDCDPKENGLTIKFLYNINWDFKNKLPEVLDFIDLYIYKESGELYRHVHLTREELVASDYTYYTILPDGMYDLVTWMNNGDCYYKENIDLFADASVRIIDDGQQNITENTTSLYYGYVDRQSDEVYEEENARIEIVDGKYTPQPLIINFAKNTNHINVYAQFDRLVHEDGAVNVQISGKNGVCNSYNRAPKIEESNDVSRSTDYIYTYTPHKLDTLYNDQGYYFTQISRITTQRLWQNDDIDLSIILQEPGRLDRELVPKDKRKLTELIMKHPAYFNNFMIERQDVYNIVFQFNLASGAWTMVDVIVNDWHLVKQDLNDVGIW